MPRDDRVARKKKKTMRKWASPALPGSLWKKKKI